jgi:hypothetical protein
MARFARPLAAALALCCLAPLPPLLAPDAALAQTQSVAAPAESIKQMALTSAQIEAYLAAAAEIEPILSKAPPSPSAGPDPKTTEQIEAVAKKNKFASYAEYDDVGANIGVVMDGIDPQTKKYVGADVLLKQEIAEVEADAKMPAEDKKETLAEMNDALKSIEPLKFPANIDLVVRYYDKIVAALGDQPAK